MGDVANLGSPPDVVRRRNARFGAVTWVIGTLVVHGIGSAIVEPAETRASFGRWVVATSAAIAAAFAWSAHRRVARPARASFAVVASASLAWAVSSILTDVHVRLDGVDETIPTIANFFALFAAPLFAIGIGRFGESGTSLRLSIRQTSDAVIVLLGATGLFVMAFGDVGPSGYVTLRTFAMLHAVLFVGLAAFAVLSFGYRAYQRAQRRTLAIFVVGTASLAVLEVARGYAILESAALFGRPIEVFAIVAFGAFGIAALEHEAADDGKTNAAPVLPPAVDLALPFVIASCSSAVIVYADRASIATFRWLSVVGLFFAVAMVIRSLVVARFASTVRAEVATHERAMAATHHLESVGLLAAGLAHDFNNLLTALLANIGLIRARSTPSASMAASLDLMEQSALRAADLARRLMSLARPKTLDLRPSRPNDVVLRIATILRASLPARIRVESVADEVDPLILLDPGQLEQAVLQLGMNAAQAIVGRGVVTISAACREGPSGRIVTFAVADDGSGMSVAVRQKVRDALFTTRGDRGGTGLGLALVRSVVSAHGGELAVESTLGRGSRFEMQLPLVPVTEFGDTRRAEPAYASGFETILVVDDRASSLLSMRASLELAGYHVIATTRPEEVSAILASERIALVVTDLDMPGTSGAELVEQLRTEGCALPIVLVTGASGDASATAAADAIVTKPFDVQSFLVTIRRTLDRGRRTGSSEVA